MTADEALDELITGSGERLLRLAYQLTHDRAAAQDVVQEALMNVYRTWVQRGVAAHPEGYSRRAVLNEHLRRRRRLASSELVLATVPDTGVAAEDTAVVDREVMWRALETLPARQRAVLVLRYYEDLPDLQIAELIDSRVATVRSLAARGPATLRAASVASEAWR